MNFVFLFYGLCFATLAAIGVTVWNIAKRKQMENTILKERNKAQQYLDVAGVIILVLDIRGNILLLNKKGEEILEVKEEEVLGKNWIENFIPPESKEDLKQSLASWMQDSNGNFATNTNPVLSKSGERRIILWHNTHLRNEKGIIIGSLSSGEDITERIEAEEKLRELSLIDELTKLNNRRGFFTLAQQQIKMSYHSQQPLILIYADLDQMKWINDTLGHQAGDRALIDAAYILRQSLRISDITARIGGDEFVALAIEGSENTEDAILKKLKKNLLEFNLRKEVPYVLSMSFGFVRYDPANPLSLDELLATADRLMYEQKQRRKRDSD